MSTSPKRPLIRTAPCDAAAKLTARSAGGGATRARLGAGIPRPEEGELQFSDDGVGAPLYRRPVVVDLGAVLLAFLRALTVTSTKSPRASGFSAGLSMPLRPETYMCPSASMISLTTRENSVNEDVAGAVGGFVFHFRSAVARIADDASNQDLSSRAAPHAPASHLPILAAPTRVPSWCPSPRTSPEKSSARDGVSARNDDPVPGRQA